MLVCYLTDEPAKIPAIRAMLEPRHRVVPRVLGDEPVFAPNGVLMVDADLRQGVCVEQIKHALSELHEVEEKLFVVHRHLHHLIAQAYALGATGVIHSTKEAIAKLAQIETALRAAQSDSGQAPAAMLDCGRVFASMFAAIGRGQAVNIGDAESVTAQIIASVTENGLSGWLDDVRKYHEGTFQHCLLVTGIAVAFALDIKFAALDVRRLGMAATLHDIGKARIPLSILDKPERLDLAQEETMRQHPVIGYDLLKDIPGISADSLDAVRHHHEYLDGTGYPDGLTAPQISDLVRLLTISDIFAALIESRPYRPAMSSVNAYRILCDMDGKLEGSLLKAFRRTALAA